MGAVDVVVDSELARLRRELERLRAENVRLSRLLDLRGQDTAPAPEQLSAAVAPPGLVVMSSPVEDKLALYIDRFRARADVHAVRWDNAGTGVSGWMPAVAGGWRKGMDRKKATYLPLTAEVVCAHLVGDVFVGLYPLLADNSAQAAADEPTAAQLRSWVTGLPAREKDTILTDLITGGDSHLRRYRAEHPADPSTTTAPRTAGELLAAAADLRAERERQDAEQREHERVRRERSAAAARQRHLDTLAVDEPTAWQQVDALIATKKPREYDTAVQLLVDLRDPAERDDNTAQFRQRLAELRSVQARKPSLLERLDLAGIDV